MMEFFRKNDSLRARFDYLATSSILFRQENRKKGFGSILSVFLENNLLFIK
jgi:hypothetical protein